MPKKHAGITIKELLPYRTILMGFSILWIMFVHSEITFPIGLLGKIKTIGYGGVDIFLICSGIGCYYSLSKDSDAFNFLVRRIKRILPTWWVFLLVWIPVMMCLDGLSVKAAIGNILSVQRFTNLPFDFNWYIGFMWLYYILAPYMVGIVNRCSWKKNLLVITVLILISVPFWTNHELLIGVTRFPIFYIGILIGRLSKEGRVLSFFESIFIMLAMMVGAVSVFVFHGDRFNAYLWDYGLFWYPFILIAPGLSYLIALVCHFNKFKIGNVVIRLFQMLGDYSFELYLVHFFLFKMISRLIENQLLPQANYVWCGAFAVAFLLSFLLRKVVHLFCGMFQKVLR